MPDIASIIEQGLSNPWLYLPLAVLLGALHALEPGHAKSIMAAFIIAVRGTMAQAVLLGLSAAVGHTIVVWVLAILGLSLGDKFIADTAAPWLVIITGVLIMALAFRLFRLMSHHHDHDHGPGCDHTHADPAQRFGGKKITNFDIIWFGFTGGLMPCPAAIAVLLICLQLKKVTLGLGMVAAFSLGLAVTLVSVGVIAAWGAHHARNRWGDRFTHISAKLPYISAIFVFLIGLMFTLKGLSEL